jgi:hypothetical protein
LNTAGTSDAYGEPSAEGYYKKLSDAYKTAVVRIETERERERERGNACV